MPLDLNGPGIAFQCGLVVWITQKIWIYPRLDPQPAISYPAEGPDQFRAPPESPFPEDTRHFPIREWLCSGRGLKARRILSCVLQEQKVPIMRGKSAISLCKSNKMKYLQLIGGPGRDRTDDLFHAMEARSQTAPQAHWGRQLFYSLRSHAIRQTARAPESAFAQARNRRMAAPGLRIFSAYSNGAARKKT